MTEESSSHEEQIIHKLYNETTNSGEIHYVKDGRPCYRHYKMENGQEVSVALLPTTSAGILGNSLGTARCKSGILKTGQPVKTIQQTPVLALDSVSSVVVSGADASSVSDLMTKIAALSQEEKEHLAKSLVPQDTSITTLDGRREKAATTEDISCAIGQLLGANAPADERLYNNVDPATQFPVPRLISDHLRRLPVLLDNYELEWNPKTKTGLIWSEMLDSKKHIIRLEHSFAAEDSENAKWIAEWIVDQLRKGALKALMAAFKAAADRRTLSPDMYLTELMCEAHKRESYFNSEERREFYELIRLLDNTKFLKSRRPKKKATDLRNRKTEWDIMPWLRIKGRTDVEGEKTPLRLTVEVYDPGMFYKDALAYVAAGYQKGIVDLRANSMLLGVHIEARKAQEVGKPHIALDRQETLLAAGLSGTDKKCSNTANRRLKRKLEDVKEIGTILDVPNKIEKKIRLKVRESESPN